MHRISNRKLVQIVLAVFFFVSVIFPICVLGLQLLTPGALAELSAEATIEALGNSVASSTIATIISVTLAIGASLALTRANIKYKNLIVVGLTVPMLIPSIAHGMGIIYLFGSNGIITNFFAADWNVYGLPGIVLGGILYSFPPAFLMIYDALNYENCVVYDAADIMGIPKVSQFTSITLPYLKKPLISAIFATFTLVITDYGVPIIAGGKYTTLSVLMYQKVVGWLNFDKGVAIGAILIVPALAAFIIDLFTSKSANLGYSRKEKRVEKNVSRDVFSYVLLAAILIFLIAPLVAFTVVGFVQKWPVDLTITTNNITRASAFGLGAYAFNSIIIAILVAAIGTILAWFAAFFAARTTGKFAKALHLICIITMAIPGIVLGMSYMLTFKGSVLYGTLAILVLVNLVHFFASPYLMAYNALGKINASLEATGQTLGIPTRYMIKDVLLPQTSSTIIEMASYFFVNCMVTISAVAFLANVSHMPLSLLISDFDNQMLIECAAIVALLIFAINVVAKFLFFALKKFIK